MDKTSSSSQLGIPVAHIRKESRTNISPCVDDLHRGKPADTGCYRDQARAKCGYQTDHVASSDLEATQHGEWKGKNYIHISNQRRQEAIQSLTYS